MGDLSVYRIAGLALDVKAALRQRGHLVTDLAALSIVHAWRDSNGGATAVAQAMVLAGVHSPDYPRTEAITHCFHADQDVVWEIFQSSAVVPPTCRCGHSRAAHEDNGRCQHINPGPCSCPAWSDPATTEAADAS